MHALSRPCSIILYSFAFRSEFPSGFTSLHDTLSILTPPPTPPSTTTTCLLNSRKSCAPRWKHNGCLLTGRGICRSRKSKTTLGKKSVSKSALFLEPICLLHVISFLLLVLLLPLLLHCIPLHAETYAQCKNHLTVYE